MPLQIYNSLTREKEAFEPVEAGKVKMYVCGMTVYSDTHIGHARTYLAFDVIRRYFEYKGFQVTYVQNVTDVDDKIIAAANKECVDPLEYSQRFTDVCLNDLDLLGIRRADMYPKASETIPDMIQMITTLIQKGYAYEAEGDVYFIVGRFKNYGKLSGQNPDEMKSGARIEPGDKKQEPLDFALWKKSKPGEPAWQSPWGAGRPGWHIECSTMSSKFLGLPFDIHGGGMDLRFPHHENEIAQAEAATGKPFAHIWMHIGLLTVDGEKMSKSLGNIVNVKDILKREDAESIRMFFTQAHYRSPPDFSEQALQDIHQSLTRIYRAKEQLEKYAAPSVKIGKKEALTPDQKTYFDAVTTLEQGFEMAMDDDFNTPKAFAEIFSFITHTNRYFNNDSAPLPGLCSHALQMLEKIGRVLTLFQPTSHKLLGTRDFEKLKALAQQFAVDSTGDFEEILHQLLHRREKARQEKDWKTADSIRTDLDDLGYEIQDTSEGPVWRKK
jgi:cysteinyl-tRNA synthetase